jgi:hypothetical protein
MALHGSVMRNTDPAKPKLSIEFVKGELEGVTIRAWSVGPSLLHTVVHRKGST